MARLAFILYDPRKFFAAVAFLFIGLPLALVGIASAGANAMTSSPPAPYTGGADVSRVIYPTDGSTVTITCTGAVVKQSPGGTPYREGWVHPSTIGNINDSSDLKGHIKPGGTNPYTPSGQNVCPKIEKPITTTPPLPQAQSSSSSRVSAHAVAIVSSPITPSSTPSSSPAPRPVTVAAAQPISSPAPTKTTSLPNTGPGNVLAIGGTVTALSSAAHYVFMRRRG